MNKSTFLAMGLFAAIASASAQGIKRTLIVHPDEFTDVWIDRAAALGLDTLSMHPVGGGDAEKSLASLLVDLKKPEFRARIDRALAKGIEVGYEMHSASWLLPRELFKTHPEYFRMDKNGKRCQKVNFCFSNAEAMDIAAKRAVELAKQLYGSSHKYFFWLDDVNGGGCACEQCRGYSESDQQLRFVNRVVTELRKHIPDAQLCYLAYYQTVKPPEKVEPVDGVFLEYAPYRRDMKHPIAGQFDSQVKPLGPLLAKLGSRDARILEYWFDNSLFSLYRKPPKKLKPLPDVVRSDIAVYRTLGFTDIACFACYLGNDYEKLWGAPDVSSFAKGFHSSAGGCDATDFAYSITDGQFKFRFDVADSTVHAVKKFTQKRDLERGDRVEVFFSATPDMSKWYYCLEIDPRGRVLDYRVTFPRKFDYDWSFKTLKCQAHKTAKGYAVEGAVEIAELRALDINPANCWLGAFRADYDQREQLVAWYSLLPPGPGAAEFHRPCMLFKSQILDRSLVSAKKGEPAFMTRDDGTKVTDVPSWKPRMREICSKFERTRFGEMMQMPQGLKMKCLAENKSALGGLATVKRIEFTWPRTYDRGHFVATAVIPNRSGQSASLVYVREGAIPDPVVSSEDWPVEEIIRRGYATIAFNGAELTPPTAVDAVSRRAWALRMIYEWIRDEPRLDEMTVGPVGCGPLDGLASLWAGSYEWRFYLCIAAQCAADRSLVELAANNTPGIFYSASCTAESPEEIANDKALAEEISPAWAIYCNTKGFGGYTDWHLREGAKGLTREDWKKFLDFTDRHGWQIGDRQWPEKNVPELGATSRENWEKKRKEYVKTFSEELYGIVPPAPANLKFEPSAPDCEMTLTNGVKVVRKLFNVTWAGAKGKGSFPVQAFLPQREGKQPAVLFLSLSKREMDIDRKIPSSYWDVEQICGRGYAAVSVYYEDISPDEPHDFNVPPFNTFESADQRKDTSWCAISAWAWGLMRVMDWIVTEPKIDAERVLVAGHSRGGKTALWTGVNDTRIAMAVPFGSGRCGMMLSHVKAPVPTETIALINANFPHWFTPRFKRRTGQDLTLPFDQHQLAACMAPRLLFVSERTGDMGRYADWFAETLAAPAWKIYGKEGLKIGKLPEVGHPAWSDGQGFNLVFGPHSVDGRDWRGVLDFADAKMKKD